MPRLSEAEIARLRAALDPATDAIAFAEGTEPPFSHPLNNEKRSGTYHCAVCGEPAFAAANKYESGSGWPSFWQAVSADAIETSTDYKLRYPRTEIHCANCGAHMGHVFTDGPPPTGERYCTNGGVLDFRPATGED
ncbi:peptide-methionine (R)-S-oxide reductase MsrB [Maricaulis sp.]|uniref:peptide-methionine (R)-S-oxide reductase MsrB n=1 Tax=Maricaulis sp. TaxID=1486257 RepID=UPI003A94072B